MKEIKDDTSRWKHMPCSWIGRTILSNGLYYPMTGCNPLQNDLWHFSDLEQKYLKKFMWKHKGSLKTKAVMRNKNRAGGIELTSDNTIKTQ